MRKAIPKFHLRESLEAKVEIGCLVSQFELIKLSSRTAGRTQLLTPPLVGAETWGSFANMRKAVPKFDHQFYAVYFPHLCKYCCYYFECDINVTTVLGLTLERSLQVLLGFFSL
jgi:hypothetical protein